MDRILPHDRVAKWRYNCDLVCVYCKRKLASMLGCVRWVSISNITISLLKINCSYNVLLSDVEKHVGLRKTPKTHVGDTKFLGT